MLYLHVTSFFPRAIVDMFFHIFLLEWFFVAIDLFRVELKQLVGEVILVKVPRGGGFELGEDELGGVVVERHLCHNKIISNTLHFILYCHIIFYCHMDIYQQEMSHYFDTYHFYSYF